MFIAVIILFLDIILAGGGAALPTVLKIAQRHAFIKQKRPGVKVHLMA